MPRRALSERDGAVVVGPLCAADTRTGSWRRVAAIEGDHDRPVAALGRGPRHTPAVHAQTRPVRAVIRALLERHPGLEIESEEWASACVDYLEQRSDVTRPRRAGAGPR